jgi:hypothetical protein
MGFARISRLQGGARSRRRSFDGTFPGVRCAGLHASGIDQVLHPTTKRTPLLQRLAQLVQAANSDTARTGGDTRYSDGRHRRLRLTTAEWRVAGGTRPAVSYAGRTGVAGSIREVHRRHHRRRLAAQSVDAGVALVLPRRTVSAVLRRGTRDRGQVPFRGRAYVAGRAGIPGRGGGIRHPGGSRSHGRRTRLAGTRADRPQNWQRRHRSSGVGMVAFRALTLGREPTSAPAHHARCADSEGGEYPRCLTAGSVRASMLALAERPARRQSDQWCGPSHRHPESESHRRGGRGPPDPPPP